MLWGRIYDQSNNNRILEKIGSIQQNVAKAMTGAIRGTSGESFCQGLGLKPLKNRRWLR